MSVVYHSDLDITFRLNPAPKGPELGQCYSCGRDIYKGTLYDGPINPQYINTSWMKFCRKCGEELFAVMDFGDDHA